MITFIKATLMKLNDQTNIEKYRVAANIAEYQNQSSEDDEDRVIISCC